MSADPAAPVAVVDLGSNSIRLVVFDRLARAPLPRYNERRFCGLGRELARTGRLAPEAIGPALSCLRRYVLLARAMGCAWIDVVATAAVREAVDGPAFAAAVEAATGERVQVLGGDEEARTSALGVAAGFAEPAGVMGDLGGSSVEFARLPVDGAGPAGASLPLGALFATELFKRDRTRLAEEIEAGLATLHAVRAAGRGRTFYVVGGSWRALGRAYMTLSDTPLKVVHGLALGPEEALALVRTILELDERGRGRLAGVAKRRLEALPAAAFLFERVIRWLEPERVVFSATGLREGRLFARLDERERARDPLLAAAADLERRDGRVPGLGAALCRWTAPLFAGETVEEARLREAACLVADTAWREHPESRARDAFFTLAHYPFLGVDHPGRAFIAYAVFRRYEGRKDDPAVARILGLLDKRARRRAEVLGAALDLAIRLSGGIPEILAACPLHLARGGLRLALAHPAVDPSDEAIRGRLQALAEAAGLEAAVATSATD
ncbi:MAG: Ppx/GppA phosphatase family protein [Geminicoccaceae bacterium]|nr:Ppx/GppA phosphatase family protein [Geminicoccaceae bacterium]